MPSWGQLMGCPPVPLAPALSMTAIYAGEGAQYRLFADAGAKAFEPNDALVRTQAGAADGAAGGQHLGVLAPHLVQILTQLPLRQQYGKEGDDKHHQKTQQYGNLILRLECFGNTLALGHLGHETVKHGFRLPINVSEMGIQPAACFQLQIQCAPVLLEKSQVALSPDVDGRHFLHGQTREVIVAPALVPQAVALLKNIWIHSVPPNRHSFFSFFNAASSPATAFRFCSASVPV